MLPFLKKQQEGSASSVVETKERKPDEAPSYDLLDAIADDFLAAIESKDKGLLKSALTSLCDHLQDMDKQQDQELMKG